MSIANHVLDDRGICAIGSLAQDSARHFMASIMAQFAAWIDATATTEGRLRRY